MTERPRLFLFLVGTRLAGWALAWVAVGLCLFMAGRILRFRPSTWEGVVQVARHGRRPEKPSLRDLPEARNARHRAARELVYQGLMPRRAEVVLRRLVRDTPDDEDYNLELGEALVKQRRYRDAEVYFERAARLSRTLESVNGYAYARLAEVQLRLGRERTGLENRKRALELGADVRRVDRHLVELFLRQEHFDQAMHFGRSADPEGQDAEIQLWMAKALVRWARRDAGVRRHLAMSWWGQDEKLQAARDHLGRCLELEDTHSGCLALSREVGP